MTCCSNSARPSGGSAGGAAEFPERRTVRPPRVPDKYPVAAGHSSHCGRARSASSARTSGRSISTTAGAPDAMTCCSNSARPSGGSGWRCSGSRACDSCSEGCGDRGGRRRDDRTADFPRDAACISPHRRTAMNELSVIPAPEAPRLLALPDNPAPLLERVGVSVGKTMMPSGTSRHHNLEGRG